MAVSGKRQLNTSWAIPFTAEIYWLTRQKGGPLNSRFSLKGLQAAIPDLIKMFRTQADIPARKEGIYFCYIALLDRTCSVGCLFHAAQGHNVTLGYLLTQTGNLQPAMFDLRRQNAYAEVSSPR